MANNEESNPLLSPEVKDELKKPNKRVISSAAGAIPAAFPMGWTADGLPMGHGVVGETNRRQWDSGLCACFGRNDEFCSSDIEVCFLGMAPCVLYGSNAERLGSAPGTFANHCLLYTGLYMLGQSFFGSNCVAPCFTYPTRTAIRRKFNLEGSCEALNRSCGCCGSFVEDEVQREQCESACDFATHFFCHPCALCQEGRELRRRLPHPGFNARQVVVMIPPGDQTMGR
ncbi:cell number regulator 8-like [Nicotiana sylvestris]|uniref:Cell number regulator 8-like n=1 Tax=Nicotiana sylvestris TaxID=4096 RepID=A0A1U7X4N5_NICSY|nr:PREDICTED: cell number regulator 8-like [Nicotiana sylvestris]